MRANRVSENTADYVNEAIRRETEDRLVRLAETVGGLDGQLDAIEARLAALDAEWDIERTLEANASSLVLIGLTLALVASRRFLALPVAVAIFLLQHAVEGWCPPLGWFRRRGVRTRMEIEEERYALKAFRGDFDHLPGEPATGGEPRMAAVINAIRKI
jgi:hypothetical protein